MGKWIAIAAGVLDASLVAFFWLRARSRNKGPVSIVILRKTHRSLTDADARGIIRRALKAEPKIERIQPDEHSTCFGALFETMPPLAIIDSARLYFDADSAESTARHFEDAAAREAIRAHKAWLAVDAHGLDRIPPRDQRYIIYNSVLCKVAAELIDDDALLLYLPAEKRFALPTPDTAAQLAAGKVAEVFADDSVNQPIFQVEASDARINAAMKEAHERLPEFISAVDRLGDNSHALIKGRFTSDDQVEYLWLEVVMMREDAIRGKVANQPYAKGLPAKDSIVDVKLDDIVDWAYVDEKNESQGMFVERILRSK